MGKSVLSTGGSNQVSLNIKISPRLNSELKALRKQAREQGLKFNVSAIVEAYLTKVVETAADELLDHNLKQKQKQFDDDQIDMDLGEK